MDISRSLLQPSAENYGLRNGGDGTYETLMVLGNQYYRPNGVSNTTNPATPTDITLSKIE